MGSGLRALTRMPRETVGHPCRLLAWAVCIDIKAGLNLTGQYLNYTFALNCVSTVVR